MPIHFRTAPASLPQRIPKLPNISHPPTHPPLTIKPLLDPLPISGGGLVGQDQMGERGIEGAEGDAEVRVGVGLEVGALGGAGLGQPGLELLVVGLCERD